MISFEIQREVGLWHAVLTSVLNGMHSVFVPYALMKTNPASWMHMITKYKGTSSSLEVDSFLRFRPFFFRASLLKRLINRAHRF